MSNHAVTMFAHAATQKENNYLEKLTYLSPEAKLLLNEYIHVPEDEHFAHVLHMRDKAWEVCPYGCIGLFGFSAPSIQRQPYYSQLMTRIKNGDKFLDLGCGLGQNIRQTVLDGGPASNIAGADLSQDLVDCGYEYFRDGSTLQSKFFIGDILDEKSSNFKEVGGQFDIIYTALFYHLWNWENQLKASIASSKLLKVKPGSVVFGWQIGATPAMEATRILEKSRAAHTTMYRHDQTSLKKMWDQVGEATGTKWSVEAKNVQPAWMRSQGPPAGESRSDIISFTITRI